MPRRSSRSTARDFGTHEQFHSDLKTDLDLERLPSGRFATNDLVLSLAGLAYNVRRPDLDPTGCASALPEKLRAFNNKQPDRQGCCERAFDLVLKLGSK